MSVFTVEIHSSLLFLWRKLRHYEFDLYMISSISRGPRIETGNQKSLSCFRSVRLFIFQLKIWNRNRKKPYDFLNNSVSRNILGPNLTSIEIKYSCKVDSLTCNYYTIAFQLKIPCNFCDIRESQFYVCNITWIHLETLCVFRKDQSDLHFNR